MSKSPVYIMLLCAFCAGCASVKTNTTETVKGFLGMSTKILEVKRKDAIKKAFPYDYKSCNEKVEKALKEIGAYIYSRDRKKGLIAVYVSQTDTTPVGVFFKQIDANNTQIEVSSPSKYGKELISAELFAALEGKVAPENKEGQGNEKK